MYIADHSGRPSGRRSSSLPPFVHDNGYRLRVSDRGNSGVKLELAHDGEVAAAIILPAETVEQLGKWLLRTLGQDEYGFPVELGGILERLSKVKAAQPILERGDKKRIRQALRALRS